MDYNQVATQMQVLEAQLNHHERRGDDVAADRVRSQLTVLLLKQMLKELILLREGKKA